MEPGHDARACLTNGFFFDWGKKGRMRYGIRLVECVLTMLSIGGIGVTSDEILQFPATLNQKFLRNIRSPLTKKMFSYKRDYDRLPSLSQVRVTVFCKVAPL